MTGRRRELSVWERDSKTAMYAESDHTRPFNDNAAMDSPVTAQNVSGAP
jgi:hypothetical protein